MFSNMFSPTFGDPARSRIDWSQLGSGLGAYHDGMNASNAAGLLAKGDTAGAIAASRNPEFGLRAQQGERADRAQAFDQGLRGRADGRQQEAHDLERQKAVAQRFGNLVETGVLGNADEAAAKANWDRLNQHPSFKSMNQNPSGDWREDAKSVLGLAQGYVSQKDRMEMAGKAAALDAPYTARVQKIQDGIAAGVIDPARGDAMISQIEAQRGRQQSQYGMPAPPPSPAMPQRAQSGPAAAQPQSVQGQAAQGAPPADDKWYALPPGVSDKQIRAAKYMGADDIEGLKLTPAYHMSVETAKAAPKRYEEAAQAFQTAKGLEGKLADMERLSKMGAATGYGAEWMLEARKAASAMGLPVSSTIAPTELFRMLSQSAILDDAQKLKPLSNSDIAFVQKGLASISTDPRSLEAVLPKMRQIAAKTAWQSEAMMAAHGQGLTPNMPEIVARSEKLFPSTLAGDGKAREAEKPVGKQAEATQYLPGQTYIVQDGKVVPKDQRGHTVAQLRADHAARSIAEPQYADIDKSVDRAINSNRSAVDPRRMWFNLSNPDQKIPLGGE